MAGAVDRALSSFEFAAPLLTTVVPSRGGIPASFTRASAKTVKGHTGLWRQAISGEVGFEGGMRVRNTIGGGTENLDTTAWVKTNAGVGTPPVVTSGKIAPDGTLTAFRLQCSIPGGGGSNANSSIIGGTSVSSGDLGSIFVKSNTGASQVFYLRMASATVAMQATMEWRRVYYADATPGTQATIGTRGGAMTDVGYGNVCDESVDILVWHPQLEDTTGHASRVPGPYVSVGSAKLNELLQTEEIDNAAWTKTFSAITANAATAPNGAQVADFLKEDATAAAEHAVKQSFTKDATARQYVYSVYLKPNGRNWAQVICRNGLAGAKFAGTYFDFQNGVVGTSNTATWTLDASSITAAGNGWYLCSITFTTDTDTTVTPQVRLASGDTVALYNGDNTSGAYVYGSMCRQSSQPSTYFPVGNVYPYHGAMVDGVKNFDYENGNTVAGNVVTEARGAAIPPQVLKGYIPHPAATNILTYGADLSNAAWTKVQCTAPQATVWPRIRAEGLPWRVTDDATAAAIHGVSHAVTVTANTNYCFWHVVHSSGSRFRGRVGFLDAATGNNGVVATFNARTGAVTGVAVGTGTLAASGYIPVAKGWGIVYVSGKIDAATTAAQVQLLSADSAGNLVYNGDSASFLLVDCFQVEAGTLPTNWIYTTNAATAANMDYLTYNLASILGSAGKVTVLVDATEPWVASAPAHLIAITDGTANNRLCNLYRTASAQVSATSIAASVTQYSDVTVIGGLAAGQQFRASCRVSPNSAIKAVNGVLGTLDAVVTPPTTATLLEIGAVAGAVAVSPGVPISNVCVSADAMVDGIVRGLSAGAYGDQKINTGGGWVDSAFISRDGRRLYFFYTPWPAFPFLQNGSLSYDATGPRRIGAPTPDSQAASGDLYCAHLRHDGTVERIECLNLCVGSLSESSVMEYQSSTGWQLYYSVGVAGAVSRLAKSTMSAAGAWSAPDFTEFANIDAGGYSIGLLDDNPYVAADTFMLCDSNRVGVGSLDIVGFTRAGAGVPWGAAANNMGPNINSVGSDHQFFIHPNLIDSYFSRDGELWHITWNGAAFNADAAKVTFSAPSPALWLGEAGTPEDFSYLYFVQVNSTNGDSRIMRAPYVGSVTAWGVAVPVD